MADEQFAKHYKAFSGAFLDATLGKQVDEGGKIVLPNSALGELARLNIVMPMMFKLTTTKQPTRSTHSGVLQFNAEEGRVYLPLWMMQHLKLEAGDIISVKNTNRLRKATFVKLRPRKKEFVDDISNPRAVLERKLSAYTCLTVGDRIQIEYADKFYKIDIMEIKDRSGPVQAACIVETDVQVDFDRPKDMPPSPPRQRPGATPTAAPAAGGGMRFNNAHLGGDSAGSASAGSAPKPGAKEAKEEPKVEEKPKFVAFSGSGRTLGGK